MHVWQPSWVKNGMHTRGDRTDLLRPPQLTRCSCLCCILHTGIAALVQRLHLGGRVGGTGCLSRGAGFPVANLVHRSCLSLSPTPLTRLKQPQTLTPPLPPGVTRVMAPVSFEEHLAGDSTRSGRVAAALQRRRGPSRSAALVDELEPVALRQLVEDNHNDLVLYWAAVDLLQRRAAACRLPQRMWQRGVWTKAS